MILKHNIHNSLLSFCCQLKPKEAGNDVSGFSKIGAVFKGGLFVTHMILLIELDML